MSARQTRTTRRAARADRDLRARLHHLDEVGGLAPPGSGRLPDDLSAGVTDLVERARTRLGRGADRTVVALAGSTGSGKSTLFNALVRDEVAPTGVRRPTTSTAQAAVFDRDGAIGAGTAELLDWLSVDRRHVVDAATSVDLDGLVLLDLPDHDSVEADHRAEVDRLVEVVDAFVWVVDPQKYADAALHEQYLRRFATHAAVTIVVLNQVDAVPVGGRRRVLSDLDRLLEQDGLRGVRVLGTSARTGEGIAELRRELAARVAERRAVVARLEADVDWLGERLAGAVGDRDPVPPAPGSRRRLAAAFAGASGADAVATAVGAAHRRRAAQAAGWPPTRWVGRLRPDPLRRLGLDRPPPPEGTDVVPRTSRGAPSTVAEAAVRGAVRAFAEDASDGLPPAWRSRVATVAASRRDDVADGLYRAIGTTALPTQAPRWWTALSGLQWVLAGAMAIGLAWLLVLGVVGWLRLPEVPTPEVGAFPLPTLLALGGAGLGLLVSAVARWFARVGARRRAAVARRRLVAAVEEASEALVAEPVEAELRDLAELHRHVRALR